MSDTKALTLSIVLTLAGVAAAIGAAFMFAAMRDTAAVLTLLQAVFYGAM